MPPPTTRIRVVVAEDHDDLRFLIRDRLHRDGRFVVVGEASNGEEAVTLVDRHRPDLILLDVRMPVMTGIEAIPRIRDISPDTYIVVLSGRPEDGVEDSALELGADRFLDKELSIPTMPALLADLFEELEATADDETGTLLNGLTAEDVISLVVHELRAPMTVLNAVGERLEASIEQMDERQIRVLSGLLHGNIRRMNELLESLSDLRDQGAGGAWDHERDVRLDELVNEAGEEFQLVASGREVVVETVPARVKGDPVRVRQVLDNLLQNAHRYGDGPIHLSMATTTTQVEVRVRDRGPGVSPADRERMFSRFVRGSNGDRQGMGLGLFLAREIVEAHGGTLAYEDPADGPGACFVVRLPLSA